MLIQFSEQVIQNCRIPAFTLSKGEIVVLHIHGGDMFYLLHEELVKILTGQVASEKVKLTTPLTYADHIKKFKRFFIPITVGRYLKRHENPANPVDIKIFSDARAHLKAKLRNLPGNLRRELSVYTTLSRNNLIMFDFAGVDPQGAVVIYRNVQKAVGAGGAAILIDRCDEFKNECTTYIKAEYIGATPSPLPPFSVGN